MTPVTLTTASATSRLKRHVEATIGRRAIRDEFQLEVADSNHGGWQGRPTQSPQAG